MNKITKKAIIIVISSFLFAVTSIITAFILIWYDFINGWGSQ